MEKIKVNETCIGCGLCVSQKEEYLSLSDNWSVINGKIICNTCADTLIEDDVKKTVKANWNHIR